LKGSKNKNKIYRLTQPNYFQTVTRNKHVLFRPKQSVEFGSIRIDVTIGQLHA